MHKTRIKFKKNVGLDTMERRLRRSRYDRIVAGVCGGLGRYMGLDPVVVRLAVVLLMLFAGMSLWVYIIMWLLIPEE